MAEIILHMVDEDTDILRDWINGNNDVAWIVKVRQEGCIYRWQAVSQVDSITPGEHCIWHRQSERLTIPSGNSRLKDGIVADPFLGWDQRLDTDVAQLPWFGSLAPGPFWLHYRAEGRERAGAIGRSGVGWLANYFRQIGKPAAPAPQKWWAQLRRFVQKQAVAISWPPGTASRTRAFVFPRAYELHCSGAHLDANP